MLLTKLHGLSHLAIFRCTNCSFKVTADRAGVSLNTMLGDKNYWKKTNFLKPFLSWKP
jgi:hypothetical protein